MMWLNFAFLFLASLFPLLIRNLAEHPGERAGTLVFILAAYATFSSLTLFRVAARKRHHQIPGFADWYNHRNRTVRIGAIMIVVLSLTSWFWPFAGLAFFVAITIWNLATL